MAPLITTIALLRQYCKGITVTSQQSFTMPDMVLADETYLWPVLGKTLYDAVCGADPLSADLDRLRELCRRVVAPLAVMNDMAVRQTQISDIGIHSSVSETLVPVSRWAYLELKDNLAGKAADAFEKLWIQLYDKAVTYNWTPPFEKTLFTSGVQFARAFSIPQPHRVFAALLPIITEVQDQYVYNQIGEAFTKELRDKANPSDDEKFILKQLRKAVANLTILKACSKLATKVTDQGFTVLMGDSGDKPVKGENDSSWTLKQKLEAVTEADGLAFMAEVIETLNKKASATVFVTYYASTYYKKPATDPPADPNAGRKSLFAL